MALRLLEMTVWHIKRQEPLWGPDEWPFASVPREGEIIGYFDGPHYVVRDVLWQLNVEDNPDRVEITVRVADASDAYG